MKKHLRLISSVAVGAFLTLGFVSCAYDPYYSTSVGGSYSTGFYGGSGSTSLFVSTGDPRWGYDPSCFSYYDYQRRSYYDPYLYGYYPVGFRPPVVYGAPHPYGWRPGSGICRPPSRVTNVTISNYRNRESAYRNSSYGWARQVSQPSVSYDRDTRYNTPSRNDSHRNDSYRSYGTRPQSSNRESSVPSYRSESPRPEIRSPFSDRSSSIDRSSTRIPSRYNTPINDMQERGSPSRQDSAARQVPTINRTSRPSSGEERPSASRDGGDGRVRGYR